LGAGVTVKVTNRINVDAGYRYYDIGSFGHEDVTLQEVYGGLRYVF
jgi:opacity protein-like surface antigen